MRIVFSVEGVPQVGCFNRSHGWYVTPVFEKPEWKGMPVDVLIVSDPDEDEVFYLEGNLDSIRSMCKDILEQIDDIEKDVREDFDVFAASSVRCEKCGAWYDSLSKESHHADGKGGECRS